MLILSSIIITDMANTSILLSYSFQKYTNKLLLITISIILLNCGAQDTGSQQPNQQTQPETITYESDNRNYTISPTEKQKNLQKRQYIDMYREMKSVEWNTMFAFQISKDFQEFHFHLATDHEIYFLAKVYSLNENVYYQTSDIEKQPAIHAIIYENNHKIIAEKTFYFQSVMKVSGKSGFTYMIRFYCPSHKLVVITHNNFVQKSHFEGKIKSSDLQEKQLRITSIKNKLMQHFKSLRTTHHIEFEQRYRMTQKLNKFANFQIAQMLLVVGVCIFQIKIISKLFKTQSII